MPGYIIDTSAWIEFFRGSRVGHKVFNYLINSEPMAKVPSIILGELRKKYIELEYPDQEFFQDLDLIHRWCEVQDIDEDMSIRAGEIRGTIGRPRISLIDCIQLAMAEQTQHLVVSTDSHFKDDERAVYLEPGGG